MQLPKQMSESPPPTSLSSPRPVVASRCTQGFAGSAAAFFLPEGEDAMEAPPPLEPPPRWPLPGLELPLSES